MEHREPDHVSAWCGSSPEFWENVKRATGLDYVLAMFDAIAEFRRYD